MAEELRIAGISDTHFGATKNRHHRNGILTYNEYRRFFKQMAREADVIVHCGDFTDRGDEESLKIAASVINEAQRPTYGVLGNHDITSSPEMAHKILSDGGVIILNGRPAPFRFYGFDISFLGIPGFEERRPENKMKHLSISAEEYDRMVREQASRFRKSIRKLKGHNNIVLFHFDQIRTHEDGSDSQHATEPEITEFGNLVDSHADNIALMLHGHDHRNIERPANTPGRVRVVDVAAKINIAMLEGKPYNVVTIPLRDY